MWLGRAADTGQQEAGSCSDISCLYNNCSVIFKRHLKTTVIMLQTRLNFVYCSCLIFLYAREFAFSFTIEELKSINYVVDILKIPIKKGEEQPHSIRMKTKFGQDYSCVLPKAEDDKDTKKKNIEDDVKVDMKALLKPMKRPCFFRVQEWWTYEVCPGSHIKQFHIEDSTILGQIITLGLYESDFDWTNQTNKEKFKGVTQPYHSQYYVNGTACDLTGKPREAEIRMFCVPDVLDYHVHRVDEQETCNYLVTVHTSRVCAFPPLKPSPVKKTHSIPCHPVLDDEHYNIYLKRVQEDLLNTHYEVYTEFKIK